MRKASSQKAYDRLSVLQKRFVDAYLGEANFNATRAAKLAGYSKASARTSAGRNRAHPLIREAISERLDEFAMTAKEVLTRLAEHGRALYGDYIGDDGIVNLEGLREAGLMRMIKKVSGKADSRVVEFHDPQSALVWLGKHHRLFIEKVEAEVTITGFEGWSEEELEEYARTGKRPQPAGPSAGAPGEGA